MPTHNESFSFAGTAANTKNTTTTGLRQLQDEFVDLMMKQSPISATMFGLNPYPDSVANYSLAAHQDAKSKLEKLKEYAATVVPKEDDDAEMGDLEFLKTAINLGISAFSGYKYELPASHLTGPITDLALEFSRQASSANDWESGDGHGKLITPPFKYTPLSSLFSLKSYQKLDSKQDLKHYKTRLFKVKPMFEEIVVAFQAGISKGITLPAESIEGLIQTCAGTITTAAAPFNQPEKAKQFTGDQDFLLPAIKESVIPAYELMKTFLEKEYLPHARKYPGIYGLPDAEKVYAENIYQCTTYRYTPEEIHSIGLKEVERIWKLMQETQLKMQPDMSIEEFRDALKDKSKFPELWFDDADMIIPTYELLLQRINSAMPYFFKTRPKNEMCEIAPMPSHMEPVAPLAFYLPGTADKVGSFRVNMALHKIKPTHQMMAVTLHEGIPGHHHQVSLALEDTKVHVIKKLVMVMAFVEGWGLYSEFLGEEMDIYGRNMIQYFGRLEVEMMRAVRLVVDTGIHWKGWSIQESADYMSKYLSLSEQETLVEVKRYAVYPGQALSYKVGELKIKELRKYATDKLGQSKFNIIDFHETLLKNGNMPLDGLEKIVKQWVASIS